MELRALDPLTPSKAAFYSAVVPGLGQIYNKSYWKVPLVYAGLGTSIYFYIDNQTKYQAARDEYKLRLRGVERTDRKRIDRKITRLNSSHVRISYAVFCLKKKKKKNKYH